MKSSARVSLLSVGRCRYTLGDIILAGGRVVNRELVSAGLAWWYRQYSKDETHIKIDEEAKNAKRGLWSDKNPQAPWEFRKNPKKTAAEPEKSGMSVEFEQEYVPAAPNEEKPFVGNSSSKKFHISSCASAGKIASGNRISFGTADEAVKAGYEPCKICSPTGETVAPVETESGGRCQATTKKGSQCKRNAEVGSKYCWQHR